VVSSAASAALFHPSGGLLLSIGFIRLAFSKTDQGAQVEAEAMAEDFSGHSLRAGHATSAANPG
jgi:hypothetical protein